MGERKLSDIPGWSEPVSAQEAHRAADRLLSRGHTLSIPPQATDEDLVLYRYIEQREKAREDAAVARIKARAQEVERSIREERQEVSDG